MLITAWVSQFFFASSGWHCSCLVVLLFVWQCLAVRAAWHAGCLLKPGPVACVQVKVRGVNKGVAVTKALNKAGRNP